MNPESARRASGPLPDGIALVVGGSLELAALTARLATIGLAPLTPVDVGVAIIRLNGPNEPAVRLTAREQEVAALVAQGLANADIAMRLGVSQATVRTHLKHIFGKLGVANRAQVAAWLATTGPLGGRLDT